jgi:hypothetical protein
MIVEMTVWTDYLGGVQNAEADWPDRKWNVQQLRELLIVGTMVLRRD